MGWSGHVVRIGNMRNAYNILIGKLKGRCHTEDLAIDGRIVLECMLDKDGNVWTGFIKLRIGISGGLL